MRKKNFGLKIIGGKELSNGMVAIEHKQTFIIQLCNYFNDLKCNAELKVNGKLIGNYRIDEYKCVTLERPLHDNGLFTFYKRGSKEAKAIGLKGREGEGFIEVVFTPQQEIFLKNEFLIIPDFLTGGVGLSGESEQRFEAASHIDVDKTKRVVIKTKLICEDEPRAL